MRCRDQLVVILKGNQGRDKPAMLENAHEGYQQCLGRGFMSVRMAKD